MRKAGAGGVWLVAFQRRPFVGPLGGHETPPVIRTGKGYTPFRWG